MSDAIDLRHTEYGEFEDKWKRCRDVIAGEDAVKGAGEAYLPKIAGMSDQEYADYKMRAEFVAGASRALDGLHGMIYRKPPTVTMPENDPVSTFRADCDLRGTKIEDYSKRLTREVLEVGRAGTIVDWEEIEARPYLALYAAEAIWNWRTQRIKGQMRLVMVALHEFVTKASVLRARTGSGSAQDLEEMEEEQIEQLRILKLVPLGMALEYQVDIWQYLPRAAASTAGVKRKKQMEWVYIETRIPLRNGKPLEFVPFCFHNALHGEQCCCKPPLIDLVSVNLHHYQKSADYNHGLHFTGLPTAWVAGFPADTSLKIGSNTAWVSENPQANAGYLEFTGQGLGALENALKADERYMAVLGARMLEEQKLDAETAETLRIRQGGEASVLANISYSVSLSLSRALKTVQWWMGTEAAPAEITDETVSIALNNDFLSSRMASADLQAIVAAWMSRAISRDTMHWNLVQGEMVPPGRTLEEEAALIESEAPVTGILMPAPGTEDGEGKGGK